MYRAAAPARPGSGGSRGALMSSPSVGYRFACVAHILYRMDYAVQYVALTLDRPAPTRSIGRNASWVVCHAGPFASPGPRWGPSWSSPPSSSRWARLRRQAQRLVLAARDRLAARAGAAREAAGGPGLRGDASDRQHRVVAGRRRRHAVDATTAAAASCRLLTEISKLPGVACVTNPFSQTGASLGIDCPAPQGRAGPVKVPADAAGGLQGRAARHAAGPLADQRRTATWPRRS